jgi:hypothetical protein
VGGTDPHTKLTKKTLNCKTHNLIQTSLGSEQSSISQNMKENNKNN